LRRIAVSFGRGLNLTAQKLVAALATLVALGALAPAGAVDRPPQFIVMAFDTVPSSSAGRSSPTLLPS
jgi:hypothetical protein